MRLAHFDYASNGAYFITICTQHRQNLFRAVGASSARLQDWALTDAGKIIDRAIREIPLHYPQVSIDHYVVMPNHIHLLLQIHANDRRAMLAPTVSRVIQQFKGAVTKQLGKSIWQESFHDVIVRSEQDYLSYWNYIDGNPSRWFEDEYYTEQTAMKQ